MCPDHRIDPDDNTNCSQGSGFNRQIEIELRVLGTHLPSKFKFRVWIEVRLG